MIARRLLSLALLTILYATPAVARPSDRDRALGATTRDLCHRRIALLGETGNHGSGETLAFKADLVERLVDHCGFSAVLFESSLYDLLELDRRRRAREEAGPAFLASAIGQLWAGDREFQPLLAFLAAQAATGHLTIAGLDNNVGSAGAFYSLDTMPTEFTRDLPPEHRQVCREALRRRIYYDYPTDRPYAEPDKTALLACLTAIEPLLDARRLADPTLRAERRHMLLNLRRAVEPDLAAPVETLRARGAAMFDNLRWHLSRLPRGTKAIVWTATVHAARSTGMDDGWGGVDDLGAKVARTYDDRAFVLGFAAAQGSYRQGRNNPTRTISPAPPSSLEAKALGDRQDVAYIGPKALAALGSRSAALFMPDRRSTARWRDALDGIVVFRTERPPIRLSNTPQPEVHIRRGM